MRTVARGLRGRADALRLPGRGYLLRLELGRIVCEALNKSVLSLQGKQHIAVTSCLVEEHALKLSRPRCVHVQFIKLTINAIANSCVNIKENIIVANRSVHG